MSPNTGIGDSAACKLDGREVEAQDQLRSAAASAPYFVTVRLWIWGFGDLVVAHVHGFRFAPPAANICRPVRGFYDSAMFLLVPRYALTGYSGWAVESGGL
jgi:hypothetical protein